MSIGPHLLGRRREHDPQSRAFAAPLRRTTAPLKSVTHTLAMPHLNQDDKGSCEGETAMEMLGCSLAINNRRAFWAKATGKRSTKYPTQPDALSCYSLATTLDEFAGSYPPDDTGTSGLGVAKALKQLGGITRYEWTFTWSAFLGALQKRPVMLGTDWYDSMFDHDASGLLTVDGSAAGGHAYLAFAYRPATSLPERIGCTNHWVWDDGSPWGVRIGKHDGCFWLRGVDLEQLLIHEQGESLVPVLM